MNVQYMKRLKRRLQETAEHYTQRAEQADSREGHVIDGEVEQLRRLVRSVTPSGAGGEDGGSRLKDASSDSIWDVHYHNIVFVWQCAPYLYTTAFGDP